MFHLKIMKTFDANYTCSTATLKDYGLYMYLAFVEYCTSEIGSEISCADKALLLNEHYMDVVDVSSFSLFARFCSGTVSLPLLSGSYFKHLSLHRHGNTFKILSAN